MLLEICLKSSEEISHSNSYAKAILNIQKLKPSTVERMNALPNNCSIMNNHEFYSATQFS